MPEMIKAADKEYASDFLLGWDDPQNIFESFAAADGEYCKDFLLAYRAVSMRDEAGPPEDFSYKASTPPLPGAKVVDHSYPDVATRNAMDELLRTCFLQAATTNQITKQLRLGMPSKGSRIYAECMRPCRPVGTSIDVKKSSFGCLKGFFEYLAAQGLVDLKPSRFAQGLNDPVITHFCWNHPDILNFSPWPVSTTMRSDESASSARFMVGASVEAAVPAGRATGMCRSVTSKSPAKGEDNSSFTDVVGGLPSPSKARARRRQ